MGDGASSSGSRGGRGSGRSGGVKGETVVSNLGRTKSHCGYCKSSGFTSVYHGLWAHSITVDDYQDLLDRGWRRSGSYLYKPEMERTCCPSYTIRLKAADFVPSKEQERVLNKMERFLDGKLDLKRPDQLKDEPCVLKAVRSLVNCASTDMVIEPPIKGEAMKEDEHVHYLSRRIDDAVHAFIISGQFPCTVELPKAVVTKLKPQAKKKLMRISEDLLYTSNISFQIVALLRRYQMAQGDDYQLDVSQNGSSQNGGSLYLSPTIVAEKLAHIMNLQGELSGMTINACNGYLNFHSASKQVESEVVNSSAFALTQSSKDHGGNGKCCQLASAQTHKKRRLEIHVKRSRFDTEEFALYKRYQIAVHKDKPAEVTEAQYRKFLVDTPLKFVPCRSEHRTVPPCGFGSFHQQYRIDGKLVAVGVVDILPRCLSSKYLFWDPDLAFLSLGKYSALKEIDWVKETADNCPSLQHYYLGYYIHSCKKMRYKAAYCPSELLCPLRYEWVPFTIARPLLDRKSYVVLTDHASLQNGASSPFQLHENSNQPPFDDVHHGGHSESPNDEDDEMEIDYEGQESETDEESNSETGDVPLTVDVSNITLDLNGPRVKFEDLMQIFPKGNMDALGLQLRRYASVVGTVLADRMVYTLKPGSHE